MKHPFDHPEAQRVFKELLVGLTSESDRGAVLVGTAQADHLLTELFEAAFPSSLSKKARESLLNYPGPLSSIAAKTEVAYALRLIPRSAYESLHAMRKLRNGVAHSQVAFSLKDHSDKLRAIHEALGENMDAGIHNSALDMMVRYKLAVIRERVEELAADHPEAGPLFKSEQDTLEYLQANPDLMEALESQLPRWKLALGVATLCSLLIMFREHAADLYRHDGTLLQMRERWLRDAAIPPVAPPSEC